ncbi:DivIVA domain-containing protein [Segniliparus rugosus]|uniref:Cell wall synthesis protein Wag31 n=1 Tax=Segniliparus rugosus (strain ATCC BAA-974 / DSM 45345 / CCUG 50838 / CIP 108380 / JCM 13579 / CDC 945) TaxID=679197 RepID=E5XTN0_SEGRC|nr:DivIVA domain-containing protein [Segniliparus rugosus]EFV12292.1 DivIVA domain-containing protein [Segniliparus rugosus ATCC BAA-974]
MRLTPEDVHNIAFGAPPEGFKGYNPEDVDVFVDLLEESVRLYRDDIVKLEARVAELEGQNAQLRAEKEGAPAAGAFPPAQPGSEAVSLLLLPSQVVRQLLAQAQGESDRLLGEFAAKAAQSGQASPLRPAVAIFVASE